MRGAEGAECAGEAALRRSQEGPKLKLDGPKLGRAKSNEAPSSPKNGPKRRGVRMAGSDRLGAESDGVSS